MTTIDNNNSQFDRLYLLSDLAVHSTVDPYGVEHMTIDLDVDPRFGVANCRAIFDQYTKRWKLISTAHATFGDGKSAIWKQRPEKPLPISKSAPIKWLSSLPKSSHVDFFLNEVNWAASPLGSLDTWPPSLQTCVNMVFADCQAAILYWGPEKVAIYNSTMIQIVSARLKKSNDLMGLPFRQIWGELWVDFEPMFEGITESGIAIDDLTVNLFPEREGYVEETFWTGSFLPIRGEDGSITGFYNRARETTVDIIRERRTKTLNALAHPPKEGMSVWHHVFTALQENDRDFPMAFVYSAKEDEKTAGCSLTLEENIGLSQEDGHRLVPQRGDLYEGTSGFLPYYRKVKATMRPLLLHTSDGSLPPELLEDFRWQGFGEKSRSVAIIPLAAGGRLLGIMVFGLNPRRPYDEDYDLFVNNFAIRASATVSSVVDKEEAHRRAERLTQDLEKSEKQIRDLAEHGPVGILIVAPNGVITWANPQFYEITGHSRNEEEHYELSFVDVVDPQDQETSASLWPVLINEHKSVSVALRIKRKWTPPTNTDDEQPEQENMWILANAYPVIENGQVTAVRASVTDISTYKWAEAASTRNASAAKEAKRLQENFIDIVSHEMRNPLSAITQLADSLSTSIDELHSGDGDLPAARIILESNVESAKTILLCAAHQKRVIDDVLTLSKLDSDMLSITPVIVQPHVIVDSVLKMFEGESESNDIEVTAAIDESYYRLGVDWVCLDPSRLTQIFINLVTNAIKFTKRETIRNIKIRTGASLNRPSSLAGVTWFPTYKFKRDVTQGSEWGTGEAIYLLFEVSDTGKGLEQEEMTRLFNRFQQATAKTHIKYGGSGLGLFISRELTESQGGEIGVYSEPGRGSTFAFYVKGRRAEPPTEQSQILQPVESNRSERRTSIEDIRAATALRKNSIPNDRLTILLVEDNLVNANVLTKQLTKAGCEVHFANHGQEALDLIAKSKSWKGLEDTANIDFDCILMDVEMPIMDGLTATRKIRQLKDEGSILKHLKVIAITANARNEQIQQTLEAGADAVQPKPFRVSELLQKIAEVLA